MDPFDFIALGSALSTSSVTPRQQASYRRTGISRAYYGAHHVVVAAFAELHWFVSQASYGHDEAQQLLRVSGDPLLTAAGVKLEGLYSRRRSADYDLKAEHPEMDDYATSSVDIAKEVQGAVDAMLTEPLRSKVQMALAVTAAARAMLVLDGYKLPHWRPLKRDQKNPQPLARRTQHQVR